jgi:hypothetical protein
MRRSRAGKVLLAAVVAALLWLVSGCAGGSGGAGGGEGGAGGGGENAPSGAKRFFQNPRVWVSDDFHEAFLYLGCSLICLNHLS